MTTNASFPRRAYSYQDGADAGYRTYISCLPDLDAGVIVLSNSASFNSGGIATQTAEAFFSADLSAIEPPRPQPQPPASPAAAPAWTPDSVALAGFTGRFFSDELKTMYTLTAANGQLVAHHRRNGDIPLRPAARDAFDGIQFGRVVFERDGSGAVTGFRVSSGRVRNLLFRRVSWPGG